VAELFVAGAPPLTVRLPDGVRVAGGLVRTGPDPGAVEAVRAWRLGLPSEDARTPEPASG
jgi:hypothetical protein